MTSRALHIFARYAIVANSVLGKTGREFRVSGKFSQYLSNRYSAYCKLLSLRIKVVYVNLNDNNN